jgi:hypothetical protein
MYVRGPSRQREGPLAFWPRTLRGIATLELLAVIAATFVLIAAAVSAVRTYSARSEVSESLLAVAPIQALIAHAFEHSGVPPASENDVPGLQDAITAHHVADTIAVEHGRIQIRYGRDAVTGLRGKSLYLTPFETTDKRVVWVCGDGAREVGLYPLGFAGGTNRTTELVAMIEPRYLPDECR